MIATEVDVAQTAEVAAEVEGAQEVVEVVRSNDAVWGVEDDHANATGEHEANAIAGESIEQETFEAVAATTTQEHEQEDTEVAPVDAEMAEEVLTTSVDTMIATEVDVAQTAEVAAEVEGAQEVVEVVRSNDAVWGVEDDHANATGEHEANAIAGESIEQETFEAAVATTTQENEQDNTEVAPVDAEMAEEVLTTSVDTMIAAEVEVAQTAEVAAEVQGAQEAVKVVRSIDAVWGVEDDHANATGEHEANAIARESIEQEMFETAVATTTQKLEQDNTEVAPVCAEMAKEVLTTRVNTMIATEGEIAHLTEEEVEEKRAVVEGAQRAMLEAVECTLRQEGENINDEVSHNDLEIGMALEAKVHAEVAIKSPRFAGEEVEVAQTAEVTAEVEGTQEAVEVVRSVVAVCGVEDSVNHGPLTDKEVVQDEDAPVNEVVFDAGHSAVLTEEADASRQVHGDELSAEDALAHKMKKARHTGPDNICEIGGDNVSDMKHLGTEALEEVFAGDQSDSAEPLAVEVVPELHDLPVEAVPEEPPSKKARTTSPATGVADLVPEANGVELKADMPSDQEPWMKKAAFSCGGS